MQPKLKPRDILIAVVVIFLLIAVIDRFTNRIDIQKYDWDFRYYIALAENGFNASPMLTPFAYRYLTPFLAATFRIALGFSTATGFKIISWIGAFGQLLGVFLIVHHFTHSIKSAYVALLAVAFSLFNLKFLMFDIYRPDHLAYALILLEFYFCLMDKFLHLLIATAIGLQIREHTIMPLIAYLLTLTALKNWKTLKKYLLPSLICIFIAFVLPRVLIPVSGTVQKTDLSLAGLSALIATPLMLNNDINFLFTTVVYCLPVLMLFTVERFKKVITALSIDVRFFLLFYTILVLLLSLYGGSDLMRYATYLFLPVIIFIGFFTTYSTRIEVVLALAAAFVYNRIWMFIPMDTMDHYLDFYGGYGGRVNTATAWHFLEFLGYIALAVLTRWLIARIEKRKNSKPAQLA